MKSYLLFQVFTLLSATTAWASFCALGIVDSFTRSFLSLFICYLIQAVLLVPYGERGCTCGARLDWRATGTCLISAMPVTLVACFLFTLNIDGLRVSGVKIMVVAIMLVFMHGCLYSIAAASIENVQRSPKEEIVKNAGDFDKRDSA